MPHRRTKAFAVTGGILMLIAAFAMVSVAASEEAGLDLDIEQDEDYTVLITVTDNETAVADANVTVEPVPPGQTYNESGTHVTDANGTVMLDPPENNLLTEISVTHANETVTEQVMLEAASEEEPGEAGDPPENFGQLMKAFVHELGQTENPRGMYIAPFAIEHNPGNAPAHAGPPGDHPHAPPANLTFEVDQGEENATVTVFFNESTVETATVEVARLGGGPGFAGAGTYTTDANGTVTFALPDRPTMTTITVSFEDDSVTERVRLDGAIAGPPGNNGGNGHGPP